MEDKSNKLKKTIQYMYTHTHIKHSSIYVTYYYKKHEKYPTSKNQIQNQIFGGNFQVKPKNYGFYYQYNNQK